MHAKIQKMQYSFLFNNVKFFSLFPKKIKPIATFRNLFLTLGI